MTSPMQKQESYVQRITHANYIVRDHRVHQIRTLPGVTLLDMVYRLSLPYLGTQAIELRNILFIQPIVTSPQFDQEVSVTFTPEQAHYKVQVTSRKVTGNTIVDPKWQANMECILSVRPEQAELPQIRDMQAIIGQHDQQWDMDDVYAVAREADISHDAFMKTLGKVYRRGQEEVMELQLGELAEKYRSKFVAHPAFLDGSTFAGYSFRLSGERDHIFDAGKAYIPFMIGRFCIYKTLPDTIYTYTRRSPADEAESGEARDVFSASLEIRNQAGELLVEFEHLTLKRIRGLQSIQRLIQLDAGNEASAELLEESVSASGFSERQSEAAVSSSLGQNPASSSIAGESQDPAECAAAYLQEQIGHVLQTDPASLDAQTGFYDLGLDSTELIVLVKKLERRVEAQLYPTLLFEYATIERLSEYLADQHAAAFQQPHETADKKQATESLSSDMTTDTGAGAQPDLSAGDSGFAVTGESSKLLIYRRHWEQAAIRQREKAEEATDAKGTPIARQYKIWLYGPAARLHAGLPSVLSAELGNAEMFLLESEGDDTPASLEQIFRQSLERLQHELLQRTSDHIQCLIVADGLDESGQYAAALEAMLRTANLEQPRISGQVILIDHLLELPLSELGGLLLQEAVFSQRTEGTVRYSGQPLSRMARHWTPITGEKANVSADARVEPTPAQLAFKPNGVYVITGGLGGLGLAVAEHIAGKFPVKLALIGRSPIRAEQEQRVQQLRELGSEVMVLQSDIGSEAQVEEAYARIKDQFGAIHGIVHSAGIIKDEFIVRKQTSELKEVFLPKVQGLFALDNVSREEQLDFFVLFSSISAVIGNLGQADYASANAIMDVFAELRQERVSRGERSGMTVSINWPLWADGGMHIDEAMERMLFASSGLKPLPTLAGLEALDLALAAGAAQAIVMYGEESRIQHTFTSVNAGQVEQFTSLDGQIEVSYGPDDIAIIGLSGRYPLAGTISEFEANLRSKRDCVTSFPQDRWEGHDFGYEVDQFYKFGGFIDHMDKFDPLFFNMSPRQAETTDPQARLFLQAAWSACEDAGFYQNRGEHHYVSGGEQSVGVFAGVFWSHYELFGADLAHQGTPMSFGNSPAAIANLVSYNLNLHGPSMAVDTMCSSSLTAIHLASESIKGGECHFAIAGGVNLVTHPHKYMFLRQAQFLASDGRCRSFGEGGDGYVPGEGVGAVLLTTVARAEREGYPVYGVIKGSAINHVGKTSGATVPDPVAQSEVIKNALDKSGIHPRTITYVEAHGTGTSLGDPIEIQGLTRAFSERTEDKAYCAIGSSKSGIGHLEAAAGIAALTKLLLQFRRGEMFPSLHAEKTNPFIPFADTPFYLERDGKEWSRIEKVTGGKRGFYSRRAGLSSFGAFGSNAHLIVEEYIPLPKAKASTTREGKPVIIPLSARNEDRLQAVARRLLDWLLADGQGAKEISGPSLREQLLADILEQLAGLLDVPASELDDWQPFVDQNVDPLTRFRLYERLEEKWELSGLEGQTCQAVSVQELADLLLQHHRAALAMQYAEAPAGQAGTELPIPDNLNELAYTLQVGREAMAVRLACVVRSTDELISALRAVIEGHTPLNGYRSAGSTGRNATVIELHTRMSDEELSTAAEQWTKGARLHWQGQYEALPQRIHIPTYPFAEQRYWVPAAELASSAGSRRFQGQDMIHPLVHRNTSDLTKQRFRSAFNGHEPFLNDHVVNGRRVLPAAAILEMVRAAVYEAAAPLMADERRLTLKQVVWTKPIVANDAGANTLLHIGLSPQSNGGIGFEIYGEQENELYSQGTAMIGTEQEQPRLALEKLIHQSRPSRWSAGEYYTAFQNCGLSYGAEHRCMESVHLGTDTVLVKLRLPVSDGAASNAAYGDSYMLHPGLLDSALQATLVLNHPASPSSDEMPELPLMIPYSLQELQIYGKAAPAMWAVVRHSTSGPSAENVRAFDIDICDEEGLVLWRVRQLTAAALKPEEKAADLGVLLYEPIWRECSLTSPISPQSVLPLRHSVLLCGRDHADLQRVEAQLPGISCQALRSEERHEGLQFQEYAIQLLEQIQHILAAGGTGKALLQVAVPSSGSGKLLAGLSGMLRTAHLEHPRLLWQLIELEPELTATEIASTLQANAGCLEDLHIRYSNGKRYVKDWQEQAALRHSGTNPWRNDGVYVITGGAGGLGIIVAKDIVTRAPQATLVLTGRSGPEQATVQDKLAVLQAEAPLATIDYVQADVSDRDQADSLVERIHTCYGALHGIIHSAGVTRDSYLLKKVPQELKDVFAPKVSGAVNLDLASRHLPLEQFIIFGSIAGSLGNAGQADYAAANAFAAAYADYRAEAVRAGLCAGKTLTIDWPLWQEGGMLVDAENEERLRRHIGIIPMSSATGLRALSDGLSLPGSRLIVLGGDLKRIRERVTANEKGAGHAIMPGGWNEAAALVASGSSDGIPADKASVAAAMEDALGQLVSQLLKVQLQDIEPQLNLSDYGFDSVTFTELTNRLNEQFHVELTPAIFFEYATIQSFAGYMAEEHRERVEALLLSGPASNKKPSEIPARTDAAKAAPLPSSTSRFVKEGSAKQSVQAQQARTGGRMEPLRSYSGEDRLKHEPIAIVGMSGKFPMADDLEALWANLLQGRNCISEIPAERWDWRSYFGNPEAEANKSNVKWGGFINGIEEFDPQFFGISPREAELMDPQQRLLMTYAWKAIEDAGYAASRLAGSDTGIFVGTAGSGYGERIYRSGMPIEGYTSTGTVSSVGPNRMSYFLDLHGPSEPIETACSSSLVAIDRAVTAIQNGVCRMAVAGGVNTLVAPEPHISFNRAGMLSEDGRCKTFSSEANGYVRGEGVGMLVLKSLADAEADGDYIHGVIRATAVNHGGRAQSLTAPNPKAQAALLQKAYEKAGIDPRTVTYIEAHGTGTALGDPIEINGLKAAFQNLYEHHGLELESEPHCGLGSIKTSIGHLELAAGVAGVIKVLLQMKHKTLVQSLHCDQINPYIQLQDSPFYIVRQSREWPALSDERGQAVPRRAGVSSFGFGGVNAHAVIEEYIPPQLPPQANMPGDKKDVVIVLSARSEERLRDLAGEWLSYLAAGKLEDVCLTDAAYTLQTGRSAFEERLGVVVGFVQELADKLKLYIEGETSIPGLYRDHSKRSKDIVSLFADDDLKSAIESWFDKGKHHKLAEIWARGLDIDWSPLYGSSKRQRLSLPTYAFARERYWIGQRKPQLQPQLQPQLTVGLAQSRMHSEPSPSESLNKSAIQEVTTEARELLNKPTGIKLQPPHAGFSGALPDKPSGIAPVTLRSPGQSAMEGAFNMAGGQNTGTFNTIAPGPEPREMVKAFGSVGQEPQSPEAAAGREDTQATIRRLQQELSASLAEALYLNEAAIDMDKPFTDMGLDSIVGVEWMRTINRRYGTDISATKVYDYPNLRTLASYLAQQVQAVNVPGSPASAEAQSVTVSNGKVSQQHVHAKSQGEEALMSGLVEKLADSLADALYLDRGKIDTGAKFNELGLDSIVGVEWLRTINRLFNTAIPVTKVYDYPTINEFARYLSTYVQPSQGAFTSGAQVPAADSSHSRTAGGKQSVDDVLQQVQSGKLDIQQAEKLLIALGGI